MGGTTGPAGRGGGCAGDTAVVCVWRVSEATADGGCVAVASQGSLLQELSKLHLDQEAMKQRLLAQEIAFNIQQTEALTRSAPGSPAVSGGGAVRLVGPAPAAPGR